METRLLFDIEATLAPALVIADAPDGTRAIYYVTGGKFNGPRVKGEVLPGGGDWFTVRSDGIGVLDVRIVLKTDDGELIYMTYGGRAPLGPNGVPTAILTAPNFSVSTKGKYAWLNAVQAVAEGGTLSGGLAGVRYRVYETAP